jgi:hypothetical protein
MSLASHASVVILAVAGCGARAEHTVANAAAPARADGPCDLVQAFLEIDDDAFRRMYAGCAKGTAIVKV